MMRQALVTVVTIAGFACAAALTAEIASAQTVTPGGPAQPLPPAPPLWIQRALETAQPGTEVPLRNADGGTDGAIIPSPAFQDAAGQTCREFQQTITVNGQAQQAFGTACRQPDGSWRLQAAPPSMAGQPQPVVAYALPPAYYYRAPFYAPVFFGFGCCFFHHHDHDHGHGHFHHH